MTNTIRRAGIALLGAAALLMSACTPAAPDMTNPTSVIQAFFAAYNAKDLNALSPLLSGEGQKLAADAQAGGPQSEAYGELFEADIVKIMQTANAELEGPRYDGGQAVFRVSAPDADGLFQVLILDKAGAGWVVETGDMMTREQFNALPDKPAA